MAIDVTFHGDVGVMLFRDLRTKTNIYWRYVSQESVEGYIRGIDMLEIKGYAIEGIVCDDKPGLIKQIQKRNIPVQLCQFHAVRNVIKKVSRKPKLQAGKELKVISYLLKKTNKDTFEGILGSWYMKYYEFLQEKSINSDTGREGYTHRKLRSAYFGLIRRFDVLFTYEEYLHLGIPNTNNSIESTFGYLKSKVNIHRGLKTHRKIKLIDQILANPPTKNFN